MLGLSRESIAMIAILSPIELLFEHETRWFAFKRLLTVERQEWGRSKHISEDSFKGGDRARPLSGWLVLARVLASAVSEQSAKRSPANFPFPNILLSWSRTPSYM
jgi:hypothetical protein